MPLAVDKRGQRKGPVMGEALPDDVFVIDAVVHAYNLDPRNARNKYGRQLIDLITGIHTGWNPPGMALAADSFRTDTSIESVVRAVFEESQTAMAVHHVLRLDSWFHDGLAAFHKTHEAVRRWPNRMIGYVGVDPLAPQEVYLDDLRRQVDQMPGAVGLKLYPHAVDPYRRWRADDDEIMALFELAHSGMAFLDETALAIGRYPNVYANLEVTIMLLHRAPGWFEEILGQLLFWGGPHKILWSTGAVLVHPQPILEKFWELRLSERVLDKFGLEQLTREDKELILGRNYAAMIGLDLESARAAQRDDEFAVHRAEHGLRRPYSRWPASRES